MITLTATGKYGKTVCEANLNLKDDGTFMLDYDGKIYLKSGSIEVDSYTEEQTEENKEIFKGTWKEDDDKIYLRVQKAETNRNGVVIEDKQYFNKLFVLEKTDSDSYVINKFLDEMKTLEFFEETLPDVV